MHLRLGEVGIIVPLLGCLLALSVWPGAISDHAFGRDRARGAVSNEFSSARGGPVELRNRAIVTISTEPAGSGSPSSDLTIPPLP
jgi:hypothetical protein